MGDKSIKFVPVRGTEIKIQNMPYKDGSLYFATDTNKIYLDTGNQRIPMGGSGISFYYIEQTDIPVNEEEELYTLNASYLIGENIIPKENDLLINSDGAFYRIQSIEDNDYICTRIAISGGGGGAIITKDLSVTIDSTTADRGSTFIQGQDYYISITGTSTIDTKVSLYFEFTGENNYSYTRSVIVNSGEPYLLNTNFLPVNNNITMKVTANSDNTEMVTLPYRTLSNLKVVTMGIRKSSVFNTATVVSGNATVYYGITGNSTLSKTLHVYIDGSEDFTLRQTIQDSSSDKTILIPEQSHGIHNISLNVSTDINDTTLYSNTITYEIAWDDEISPLPLIWTASYDDTVIQYENFVIQYQVFDPEKHRGKDDYTTIYIYKHGSLYSEISRKYVAGQWLLLDLTESYEVGNNEYTIVCGSASKTINFFVTTEGSRDLGLVQTDSLIFNLSATGRSNNEIAVNRPVWTSSRYSATFNNFNWYSNGWKNDNDGAGSYLSVTNGASVTIPFLDYSKAQPMAFLFNDGTNNYSFELRFRIRNVQEYSTLVSTIPYYYIYDEYGVKSDTGISINEIKRRQNNGEDITIVTDDDGNWVMDEKNSEKVIKNSEGVCLKVLGTSPAYGLCIGTQEAYFRSPEGVTSVRYKEDEIINFSVVVSTSEKLASIYLNGILSGSLNLGADSSFNIGNLIEINSDYCDIDVYKIRFYKYGLTMPEVIHNYISDIHNITLYDQNQLTKDENPTLLSYTKLVNYNQKMLEEGNIEALTMPYAVIEIIDNATGMTNPNGTSNSITDDLLPWMKGNNRYCKITFVNPILDALYNAGEIDDATYETHSPSYICIGADINVQGTSSQGYPRRNFKTKMKSAVSQEDFKEVIHDDWGWFYTNEKFIAAKGGKASFKKWKQDNPTYGTNKFTWKIDYMESSGSYNTGFANLVGNNIYSTHPLGYYHIPGLSDTGLRTSVYGFPVLTFHKHSKPSDKAKIGTVLEDEIYEYIGRYNLNQDKGSDELYGFSLDVEQPYVTLSREVVDETTGETVTEEYHPTIADVAECWEMTDNQGTWTSFSYPSTAQETHFSTYTADSYDDFGEPVENPRLEVIRHYECRYHKYADFIEAIALDEKPYDLQTVVDKINNPKTKQADREIWETIDTVPKMNQFIIDKWSNWERFVTWCDSTDRRKADFTRDIEPVEYEVSKNPSDMTGVSIREDGNKKFATFTKDTAAYRLQKFKSEFSKHLNLEYCTVYFVMTELLLCYDSRGKNMMMASYGPMEEGGEYIWFPIFYDIDTQLGLNNIGATLWDYDTDATLEQAFSTPSSVLWVNFLDCFEDNIKNKYMTLRGTNALSYETIDGAYLCDPTVFDSYAMRGLRPMIAIGLDEYYKYVAPSKTGYYNTSGELKYDNNSYAYAVNGDRMLSRELLLRNRLNYLDSYWVAGDYTPAAIAQGGVRMRANANNQGTSDKYLDSNSLQELPSNAWAEETLAVYPVEHYDATPEFEITPFLNQYVFTYNDKTPSGDPVKYQGVPVKTTCGASVTDGYKITPGFPEQIIIVPAEDYISSLGDLSLKYLSQFTLLNGRRILDLDIGSDAPNYFNNLLGVGEGGQFNINDSKYIIAEGGQAILNPSRKTLLKRINLTNVKNLSQAIDLSGSEKLQECRALGTQVQYILFAEGAPLDTIHLPSTVSRIDLTEARELTHIITSEPVVFNQPRDSYTGLYIKGVTDLSSNTDPTEVALNRINIVGGSLGYDSYKLLVNALEIRDRENNNSLRLRVNLEDVDWSPYKIIEPGTPYNPSQLSSYYQLTDHNTFVLIDQNQPPNAEEWNNLTLNGKLFIYEPNSDSHIINSLSILEKFILDYERASNDNGNSYYTNLTNAFGYPNITGTIYVDNSANEDDAIDEVTITERYGPVWDKLKIYAAKVNPSYITKFIQILDNGKEDEVDVLRIERTEGAVPSVTAKVPIKQNYNFLGWSLDDPRTESNPTLDLEYQNGAYVPRTERWSSLQFDNNNEIITLYAIFELHKYSITFYNSPGEQPSYYVKEIVYNQSITQPSIEEFIPYKDDSQLALTKTYQLAGWAIEEDGKPIDLTLYKATRDYTFYPVFREVSVYDNVLSEDYYTCSAYANKNYNDPYDSQYSISGGYELEFNASNIKGKITLPTQYKGVPIIGIVNNVNNPVTLPDITHVFFAENENSIRYFGQNLFYNFTNLQYVEFPTGLRQLGQWVFVNTPNLGSAPNTVPVNTLDLSNTKLVQLYYGVMQGPLNEEISIILPGTIREIGNPSGGAFINSYSIPKSFNRIQIGSQTDKLSSDLFNCAHVRCNNNYNSGNGVSFVKQIDVYINSDITYPSNSTIDTFADNFKTHVDKIFIHDTD